MNNPNISTADSPEPNADLPEPNANSLEPKASAAQTPPPPLRIRYRVRFGKTGLLRWIGHIDLAKLWERIARRAELKLSMTEGFHPKPRIGFPSALALGVESHDEVVEIELAQRLTPQDLLGRLIADNQPGLTIHNVSLLPEGFGKAQLAASDYVIDAPGGADLAAAALAIDQLKSAGSITVERKKKTHTFDVAADLPTIEIVGEQLRMSITNSDGASLKPSDVLACLKLDPWIEDGATITRTRVRLKNEFETDDANVFASNRT